MSNNLLPSRDIDLRDRGGLIFYEDTHSYFNADGVKYTGMTTFLKQFVEEFRAEETAKYKAIKESLSPSTFSKLKDIVISKKLATSRTAWQHVHIYFEALCEKNEVLKQKLETKKQEILDEWAQSTTEGSIEHDKREKEVIENGITWNGKYYPYSNKTILDLTEDDVCVIPEIMVWDHEKQLCGLIDLPIFDKGVVHILDYKTNKKIDMSGFQGKKMKGIFKNHDDCNHSKYSAQLYGYQKMACELTGFKPGECWIISTASKKYKRPEDVFIKCTDMSKEIDLAFKQA